MLKTTSEILRDKGLTRPTILIDQARAKNNIRRMAQKAADSGAVFRPHFKTHQSGVVGRWFHEAGVRQITVSSLTMAEYFADLGWRDITVAVLHTPLANEKAGRLATHLHHRGGNLSLLVDGPAAAADISNQMSAPTDIWLKLDTGYGRTGIHWDNSAAIREVMDQCRELTTVRGLLTHAGHSYAARGRRQINAIYNETIGRMQAARSKIGRPDLQLSFGDTPCCSLVEDLSACDEIRPGNFVFNDLMQRQIGSCTNEQLAAAVACPVIGIYPDRRQIVLHGGAVHLAKESLTAEDGKTIYGCLGTITPTGLGEVLPWARLVSLSQEHGVVEFEPDATDLMNTLAPGDLALVWPVHSCLTCNLLRDQMAVPLTV